MLRKNIEKLLNQYCAENKSNTPDFILADYLMACLESFDNAIKARDQWYGVCLKPHNIKIKWKSKFKRPDEVGDISMQKLKTRNNNNE